MSATIDSLKTLKVNRESLSAQVAEQIQNIIIQGGLVPGDKLPSERQLAEQLGVSRTVVREATHSLQERGLVRVASGSGVYVTRLTPDVVIQNIRLLVMVQEHSFQDLMEVRLMIEGEIAGLAAQRAGNENLAELDLIVQEMEKLVPQVQSDSEALEQFAQADMLFHQALARATGNVLLPVLLSPITDLMLEFRRTLSKSPGAPERAFHFHQAILRALRRRDVESCRQLMGEHMREAEGLATHPPALANQPNP